MVLACNRCVYVTDVWKLSVRTIRMTKLWIDCNYISNWRIPFEGTPDVRQYRTTIKTLTILFYGKLVLVNRWWIDFFAISGIWWLIEDDTLNAWSLPTCLYPDTSPTRLLSSMCIFCTGINYWGTNAAITCICTYSLRGLFKRLNIQQMTCDDAKGWICMVC